MVEEYRRFLVLTQVAGQAVSPSPDVDEAWHLHLTRTVRYEAFCADNFGRFLHHEPARAGEGARHKDMYGETLARYREAFGSEPPSAIWPRSARAAAASRPADAHWTVPELLRPGRRLAIVGVLGAVAAGLFARNVGVLDALQEIPPFTFLLAALFVTVALGWLGFRQDAPATRLAARDRLDPYEAAWLSGGEERMAMTAIVALTDRGLLRAPGKGGERAPRPVIPVNLTVEPRFVHPAEAVVMAAQAEGGVRFGIACLNMRPLADQFERRLVAAGLARDTDALPLPRARALLGMALLLAVEVERIVHALGTPHRIGFLVLLTLGDAPLVLLLARRPRRANPRSEVALRSLRLAAGQSRKTPAVGQALAFGVAVAGTAALADDLRFDGLGQQVNIPSAMLDRRTWTRKADGGSSDGSSCSSCGSSDGGGDGGSGGDGGGSSCGSSCGSGCGGGGD